MVDKTEAVKNTQRVGLFPFALTFPLLCIAFGGCWNDGCQGALNAQSSALHEAYVEGGWGY